MNNASGVQAFGVKMGIIQPNDDIVKEVVNALTEEGKREHCHELADGDIVCVTESVVARSQNNYITQEELSNEIRKVMGITKGGKIGVLFPILSRNRFAFLLKGIAKATETGEVVIQFSYPTDEVGNPIIDEDYIYRHQLSEPIYYDSMDAPLKTFKHPVTGVNYIEYYKELIESEKASAKLLLSNNPVSILKEPLEGLIIASLHKRHHVKEIILEFVEENKGDFAPDFQNKIFNLDELFSKERDGGWSEYGLLASNLADSATGLVKLAPRNADKVAEEIKSEIKKTFGKSVEVMVYGDGCFKDNVTGIWELADPEPALGCTTYLKNLVQYELKFKLFVSELTNKGLSREEIESTISAEKEKVTATDFKAEGTTPRMVKSLVASLADLVSGSGQRGTPLVVVKNYLLNYKG